MSIIQEEIRIQEVAWFNVISVHHIHQQNIIGMCHHPHEWFQPEMSTFRRALSFKGTIKQARKFINLFQLFLK